MEKARELAILTTNINGLKEDREKELEGLVAIWKKEREGLKADWEKEWAEERATEEELIAGWETCSWMAQGE